VRDSVAELELKRRANPIVIQPFRFLNNGFYQEPSIGLDDQEIQTANEAGDTVRKQLETGPFEIEVPVKAGRSKISIEFLQAANLPKGDGRNVPCSNLWAVTPAPVWVDRMSRFISCVALPAA
jgi:hypothetical protein